MRFSIATRAQLSSPFLAAASFINSLPIPSPMKEELLAINELKLDLTLAKNNFKTELHIAERALADVKSDRQDFFSGRYEPFDYNEELDRLNARLQKAEARLNGVNTHARKISISLHRKSKALLATQEGAQAMAALSDFRSTIMNQYWSAASAAIPDIVLAFTQVLKIVLRSPVLCAFSQAGVYLGKEIEEIRFSYLSPSGTTLKDLKFYADCHEHPTCDHGRLGFAEMKHVPLRHLQDVLSLVEGALQALPHFETMVSDLMPVMEMDSEKKALREALELRRIVSDLIKSMGHLSVSAPMYQVLVAS